MKRLVVSSAINGTLRAAASKSMAQRAIAIATVASSPSTLHGVTESSDVEASLQAAASLGAGITHSDDALYIDPRKRPLHHTVNCSEAGLTVRMFAPVAALFGERFSFTGAPSLMKRPITMIEEALVQLGATCSTNGGYLPMTVQGPIRGGTVRIDGGISSQLLTGLLISLPLVQEDSVIEVINLKSRPYIDMTLDIIRAFGVDITHRDYTVFSVPGSQAYSGIDYTVEGDWSGAAFFLVAGALSGSVTVTNLRNDSPQADRLICDVLDRCGAVVETADDSVSVCNSALVPLEFDASDCPELFPPLAALDAGIRGRSVITGTHRLVHKESNRKETLLEEFSAIGVDISEEKDSLVINGGSVPGGSAKSHNDHRIAMALACAGLVSENGVSIDESEAVAKSYPSFFDDLGVIGAGHNR